MNITIYKYILPIEKETTEHFLNYLTAKNLHIGICIYIHNLQNVYSD